MNHVMVDLETMGTNPNAPIARYIGTKLINATPMTRIEYNALRGWVVPPNENPEDPGFLVEYIDGGAANVPGFAGYVSWSPQDVFERAYRPVQGMSFGLAIEALKRGLRVTRAGWNGKDMWLALTEGRTVAAEHFWSPHNREFAAANGGSACVQPYITMKTAQGMIVPWLASQSDMLSDDWMLA